MGRGGRERKKNKLLLEHVFVAGMFGHGNGQDGQSKQLDLGQPAFLFFEPLFIDDLVSRRLFDLRTKKKKKNQKNVTSLRHPISSTDHKPVEFRTNPFYSLRRVRERFVLGVRPYSRVVNAPQQRISRFLKQHFIPRRVLGINHLKPK